MPLDLLRCIDLSGVTLSLVLIYKETQSKAVYFIIPLAL